MGDQTQAYDIFQTPLSSGYPLPLNEIWIAWSQKELANHRVHTECQAVYPVVWIGAPPSHFTRKRVLLPPFGSKGGDRLPCGGRGVGGTQFRRWDRHSGTLGIIPLLSQLANPHSQILNCVETVEKIALLQIRMNMIKDPHSNF